MRSKNLRHIPSKLHAQGTALASLGLAVFACAFVFGPSQGRADVGSGAIAPLAAAKQDPQSVSRRFIVKLKNPARGSATPQPTAQALRAAARELALRHSTTLIKQLPESGLSVFSLTKGKDMNKALKQLNNDPAVLYAEPDHLLYALSNPSSPTRFPNDPRFSELYGLHNTGQDGGTAGQDISAAHAWVSSTGSAQVVVGVIDSGVYYGHEDLAANMWVNSGEIADNGLDDDGNGYIDDVHGINAITRKSEPSDPDDDNGHGTHVAGTIGAVGNNGKGIVGVNWNTRIMALKFLDAGNSGYTSDAIECIEYALAMKKRGVKLMALNNSWGGGNYNRALITAIENARQAGVLFVAAAGNDSNDNDANPNYPSNYPHSNVIAVAAVGHNGRLAHFSNYGRNSVDIAAPGVSILSAHPVFWSDGNRTDINNYYLELSGTSMAAPHVTGAAALLWSKNPSATLAQVREQLLAGADVLPSLITRKIIHEPSVRDLFFDDMDALTTTWSTRTVSNVSTYGWTLQSERAYGDTGRAWHDSPGGDYPNNSATLLRSKRLDLSAIKSTPNFLALGLSFYAFLDIENNYESLDVSILHSGLRTRIGRITTRSKQWHKYSFLVPETLFQTDVQIELAMRSDASITYDGVYIDDLGLGVADDFESSPLVDKGRRLQVAASLDLLSSTSPLSFEAFLNAPLDVWVTSQQSPYKQSPPTATLSVSSGMHSVNGNAFSTLDVTVRYGDRIRLRHKSATARALTRTTSVTLQAANTILESTSFISVTAVDNDGDIEPDAFSFSSRRAVPRGALVVSNLVTISGLGRPTRISINNGEYSVEGQPYEREPGVIRNGESVRLRHTATSAFLTTQTTTLNIGGISSSFLSVTEAQDLQPGTFSFPTIRDVARNTTVVSAAATVTGVNSSMGISVSVSGGEYSIDGAAFTGNAGPVTNGQSVRLRHTAASAFSTTQTTTLNIGNVSVNFLSVTEAPPDAFSFPTIRDVARNTTVVSAAATVTGLTGSAAISVSGGEYSIDGAAFTGNAGTATNDQSVRLRHTAASAFSTTQTTTLSIGNVSVNFLSVTEAPPDALSFPIIRDVARNTTVVSAAATVTGLIGSAALSVSGGEYSINGAAFTGDPGTVTNDQSVRLRHTAASAFSTTQTTTLSIGEGIGHFLSVTEAQDLQPDAFSFPTIRDVARNTIVVSAAATVTGINDSAAISVSGGEYSIDGAAFTGNAGTVTNGQSVRLRHRSAPRLNTVLTSTLRISNFAVNFASITERRDLTPDDLRFSTRHGVSPNTVVFSNTALIKGISESAPITVSSGQYSVNGAAFSTRLGSVDNGDELRIRHISSSAFHTPSTTLISIGNSRHTFLSYTEFEDSLPNPLGFETRRNVPLGTVITSEEQVVNGINTDVILSVNGGAFSLNGGPFTSNSRLLSSGDRLRLRHVSATDYGQEARTMALIGSSRPVVFASVTLTGGSRAIDAENITLDSSGYMTPVTLQARVVGGTNANLNHQLRAELWYNGYTGSTPPYCVLPCRLLMPSGSHRIVWRTLDTGIEAAMRRVNLRPQANLLTDQVIAIDANQSLRTVRSALVLSGLLPTVPATFPLTVSGNGVLGEDYSFKLDHGRKPTFVIENPLQMRDEIEIDIKPSAVGKTISLSLGKLQGAATLGARSTQTFTVVQGAQNRTPQMRNWTQDNVPSIVISQGGTPVWRANNRSPITLSVHAYDLDGDDLSFNWRHSSAELDLNSVASSRTLLLPQRLSLPAGFYQLVAHVSDSDLATASASRLLELFDGHALPEGDHNSDGLADGHDLHPSGLALQYYLGAATPIVLAENGVSLSLGPAARQARGGAALAATHALTSHLTTTGVPNEVIDIEARGMAPGSTTTLTLWLEDGWPQESRHPSLMIYSHAIERWQVFDPHFALSDLTYTLPVATNTTCPSAATAPPRSTRKPRAGEQCLYLVIKDGDLNDTDGRADGNIFFTGTIVTARPEPVAHSSSGGGGCATYLNQQQLPARLDFFLLLFLGSLCLLLVRKNKSQGEKFFE